MKNNIDNLTIYVTFYKDYFIEDSNILEKINKENHKIIFNKVDRDLKTNLDIDILINPMILDERLYSELSNIYWLYLKVKENPDQFSKYIGSCHYRRYFDFSQIDTSIFSSGSNNILILPQLVKSPFDNITSYNIYHNVEDLFLMIDVINDIYHEKYVSAIDFFKKSNCMLPYNMFISSKEIFLEYCEFVFSCLFEIDKRLHLDNKYENMVSRITNNQEKYFSDLFKNDPRHNTVEYQARIYGFLAERLGTIFFINKLLNKEIDCLKYNDLIKINCF